MKKTGIHIKLKGYRKFLKRTERIKKELEGLKPYFENGTDIQQIGPCAERTQLLRKLDPTIFEAPAIAYGVEWDYGKGTITRKGLAAGFDDPSPAENLEDKGSSPFDRIFPWSGMKRYNVIDGEIEYTEDDTDFSMTDYDTVVYIPEFYYMARKDQENRKWIWMVSPVRLGGYKKHPGSGRYIGRYHTSGTSTEVFSVSGELPLTNTSQSEFRKYSREKGEGWRMLDLATWSAVQMLYLVEFADFDARKKLGAGWTKGRTGKTGGTDNAAYHTVRADGGHNQYRWIEDPFSNVLTWIDGFLGSRKKVFIGGNDGSFDGTEDGMEETTLKLPDWGYISGFGYDEKADWAFIPDKTVEDFDKGCRGGCAYSNSSSRPAFVGGNCNDYDSYGLFYLYAGNSASYAIGYLGSRLLFDP